MTPIALRKEKRSVTLRASICSWHGLWISSRGLTEAQELEAVGLHIELQHYIHETMEHKRKNPGDDIITRLLNIEVEDSNLGRKRPLTDAEIIGITDHLLIGGNETTAFALSNGLWLLFRNPDTYAALQKSPDKIKNFVEEVLRIESPTQGLYRFVKEDCEIGGVPVPKGATLSIRYGAGNHDDHDHSELTAAGEAHHLASDNVRYTGSGQPFTQNEHGPDRDYGAVRKTEKGLIRVNEAGYG